jgi:predicted nucleic acid-binding Zn ribbon protein
VTIKRYRGPPRALEARSAGQAVNAALAFRGITDSVRGERLIAEWTDFVGTRIAARTRPEGIYDRVLVIEVASSAWLHELNLLRAQILAGLFERVGLPRLFDELKFRIAGRGRARVVPSRPRPPMTLTAPTITPATGLARELIIRETETIDDDELRELVARVRITHDR